MRHLFVVVREDLAPGPQAVQSVHAAVNFVMDYPEVGRKWFEKSNYLSLHSVPDEDALLALARTATDKGVRVSVFYEADLNNQATAIALEPGNKAKTLCSHLPLTLR